MGTGARFEPRLHRRARGDDERLWKVKGAEVRKPRQDGVEHAAEFLALTGDGLRGVLRKRQRAHRVQREPDYLEPLLPGGVGLVSRTTSLLFCKQTLFGGEGEARLGQREIVRILNKVDRRAVGPPLDKLAQWRHPALCRAHSNHLGPAEVLGDILHPG